MGGGLCLAALSSIEVFDGGAPFYGCPDLEKYPVSKIKCPILANFATNDKIAGRIQFF